MPNLQVGQEGNVEQTSKRKLPVKKITNSYQLIKIMGEKCVDIWYIILNSLARNDYSITLLLFSFLLSSKI